jgi:hypothetical protein
MKKKWIKRYCKLCEKESRFILTVSPKGYFVCDECHFRTDFGREILIRDQFGHHFEENPNFKEPK